MSETNKPDLSVIQEFLEIIRKSLIQSGETESDFRESLTKAVSEIKWSDIPESLPRDGSLLRIKRSSETVVKWVNYRSGSQQFRKGIKGRWVESGEYGGFYNAKFDPEGVNCTFLGTVA